MHAVVRNYSGKGAKALIDLIEKNKVEEESLIRSVKGFGAILLSAPRAAGSRCPSTRTRPAPTRAFAWHGIGS